VVLTPRRAVNLVHNYSRSSRSPVGRFNGTGGAALQIRLDLALPPPGSEIETPQLRRRRRGAESMDRANTTLLPSVASPPALFLCSYPALEWLRRLRH
jgi:hypothetical protein